MAYAKKASKNEAYQKLKTDLKEGNPLGNAYLFYGEESYLREYYLGEIKKKLIPAGFEEFNYHVLEGKDLTAQSLTEMAETMPMMIARITAGRKGKPNLVARIPTVYAPMHIKDAWPMEKMPVRPMRIYMEMTATITMRTFRTTVAV